MSMDIQTNTDNTKLSAIERALAAAKARKAMKESLNEPATATATPAAKPTKEPKVKAQKDVVKKQKAAASDEASTAQKADKAAKKAAEAAAKAERKAQRDAERAERRAAKAAASADRKPAHMKKVDRARAKCPALASDAEVMFGDITANLSAQQIDALAQHLLVHVRATRTMRAAATDQLPLGATVRITGGEPKYIGLVGKVVHSQKLRVKVEVPLVAKPVYLYTGEAELVQQTVAAAS